MKNRTIIGIICIALAVIITFGIAPLVNKMSDGRTEIIRITKDIKQGLMITESDVEQIEVGSFNLPDSVLKDKSAVIGKYAGVDLKAGDYLMNNKLSSEADSAENIFRSLDGNKRVVSITIGSFASGLSGKLQNRDIVSIMVIPSDKNEAEIPNALRYVRVVTTTTSGGADRDQLTANEDGSFELPSTVTLIVNEVQAKLLAHYEAKAKIHILLVYRGDAETSQKFLDAQDVFFQNTPPVKDEVPADE